MHFSRQAVRHHKKIKGYTIWGGCQMGRATSIIAEGRKPVMRLFSYGGIIVMEAIKWLIENPAQQAQVQKGEQTSV